MVHQGLNTHKFIKSFRTLFEPTLRMEHDTVEQPILAHIIILCTSIFKKEAIDNRQQLPSKSHN